MCLFFLVARLNTKLSPTDYTGHSTKTCKSQDAVTELHSSLIVCKLDEVTYNGFALRGMLTYAQLQQSTGSSNHVVLFQSSPIL
jgi:hypothetical protein